MQADLLDEGGDAPAYLQLHSRQDAPHRRPRRGQVETLVVGVRQTDGNQAQTDYNIADAKVAYMQQNAINCIVDDKSDNCSRSWCSGILPYQASLYGKAQFSLPDTVFAALRRMHPQRFQGRDDCGSESCPFPRNLDGVVTAMCLDRMTGRLDAKINLGIELAAERRGYDPQRRVGYNPYEAES